MEYLQKEEKDMNNVLASLIKYPFSGKARSYIKKAYRDYKFSKEKLIMTLVVKNEEDIVEQNIRFHCAMGADGFIVTSHNCTDNTNAILDNLKKEGLVLDVIYQTGEKHQLNVWVNQMIKLATKKYGATWMINADADEFYYSKSLNLKQSIQKCSAGIANVLWVDALFLFPDNRDNFLECPFFVTSPFTQFMAEQLNIYNIPKFKPFIGSQGCTKVIHKTSDHPKAQKGNHTIIIKNKVSIEAADIKLFHYHIKNYKGYENKVKRWKEAIKYKPEGESEHLKKMISLYDKGDLYNDYCDTYNENMRNFLMEYGVVTRDLSVSNFLHYKGII